MQCTSFQTDNHSQVGVKTFIEAIMTSFSHMLDTLKTLIYFIYGIPSRKLIDPTH